MYFHGWIILVAYSHLISLLAFFWGLQSGQFSDQERARFLPLRDARPRPTGKDQAKWAIEVYVLWFVGLMVLSGLGASLFLSFNR